jgi:hypothetical protein
MNVCIYVCMYGEREREREKELGFTSLLEPRLGFEQVRL